LTKWQVKGGLFLPILSKILYWKDHYKPFAILIRHGALKKFPLSIHDSGEKQIK